MIGTIITISDMEGQRIVDASKNVWEKHGYIVESLNYEEVISISNWHKYFLIVFTMNHEHCQLFHEYEKHIRDISSIPIVFFPYDKFSKEEEIKLINAGADQVIKLPTDMDVAIENCIAIIRRSNKTNLLAKEPPLMYCYEDVVLSVEKYSVHIGGRDIKLRNKECHILMYLMEYVGKVKTYNQIITEVWGEEYIYGDMTFLWSQMNNLRRKIQWKPDLPIYIQNTRGVGYSFNPEPRKS